MASLPAGFTERHLHDSTRSKRSAARLRRYSGRSAWAPSQSKRFEPDNDPLFGRAPVHVGDLDHRVLEMGGDNLQVLFIEDDELI